MPKRDYGTGSLIERAPNRWQIRYYTNPDPFTGKRHRKSHTFTGTKREATKKLADLTASQEPGESRVSLGDVIAVWRATAGHQLGTARNYNTGAAAIPAPFLATPISDIRAATIRELLHRVTEAHGTHRARLVHAVISGALTHAWRNEWTRENVARRVPVPGVPRRKPTQPAPAQMRALFGLVAEQPQLYAWLVTSADSGARRGEILALRWSHVRLTTGELHIEQALDPIDGHEKTTKTGDARTVAIGPATVAALRHWHTEQAHRAVDTSVWLVNDPFVFSDALDGGTPWRPDVATKRFARLRKRAGVEGVRLYDVRHYVASELLGAGVDPKTVAGRLGHTRVSTTTDLYGHVLPARDRTAAGVLEAITTG